MHKKEAKEIRLSSLKIEDEWFTTHEAAKYLRIPVGSLRNLTSNGKIKFYKLGSLNRYRCEDLRGFLLSNERGGF